MQGKIHADDEMRLDDDEMRLDDDEMRLDDDEMRLDDDDDEMRLDDDDEMRLDDDEMRLDDDDDEMRLDDDDDEMRLDDDDEMRLDDDDEMLSEEEAAQDETMRIWTERIRQKEALLLARVQRKFFIVVEGLMQQLEKLGALEQALYAQFNEFEQKLSASALKPEEQKACVERNASRVDVVLARMEHLNSMLCQQIETLMAG